MEEQIIIYLIAPDACFWCRRGEQTVKQGHLHDAVADAGERDIIVVLPGEDVVLVAADLPPIRQASRRLQATRYALEEQLATPVEKLHFCLGPKQGQQPTPVAVIEDESLRTLLADFGPARSQVIAVVPDTLCLPAPDKDSVNLRLVGERALVRRENYQGFSCELSLVGTLLAACGLNETHINLTVAEHTPDQAAQQLVIDRLLERGHIISQEHERDEYAWLAQVNTQANINLLQAGHATGNAANDLWWPLRTTAALAGIWLILALATHTVNYFQLSAQARALDAQAEATFREAFPKVQTINDIRVQAEQNLRQLRGSGGISGIFPLLDATALATSDASGLTVQSLQYRDGTLSLNLRGEDIQALESLRSNFGKQQNAQLDVESADAASEGVQIRARVTGAGA